MAQDNSSIDIQDLLLEVQAELAEIFSEVAAELQLPQVTRALQKQWASMSPEQKEMIQKQNPEAYGKLISMIGSDTSKSY